MAYSSYHTQPHPIIVKYFDVGTSSSPTLLFPWQPNFDRYALPNFNSLVLQSKKKNSLLVAIFPLLDYFSILFRDHGAPPPPPPPIISKNSNSNKNHRPQYAPCSNTSGKQSNVSLPHTRYALTFLNRN